MTYLKYILRKCVYGFLVLTGVVVIVFFLFQGLGDPARLVMGQTADVRTQENIRRELNLDKPKWKQFLLYVNDLSPIGYYSPEAKKSKPIRGFYIGNVAIKWPYLRTSYQSRKPVLDVLLEALPGTLLLATAAMIFATVVGIALGVLAATRQNTWLDTSSVFASVVGISAPSFFMAIVIAYLLGFLLHDMTGLPMTGSWFDISEASGEKKLTLQHLILPALTLGIRPLAIITQLTRSSLLDVMNMDYVRTARAKGLPEKVVIRKHALRNALNPVLTAITGWFAELLAGAFFVETIFGWKGIGKVTVDALDKLDFPVVMGSVLLTAALFVLINLLSDLLYARLDPRIKL